MKKKLIIANWKMNLSIRQGVKNIQTLYRECAKKKSKNTLVLCPDFTTLSCVSHFLKEKKKLFSLGAQDCFYESRGTYTGEISPQNLKELGCDYVIIGHSERRMILQESSDTISKKIHQAIFCGLIPIVCVGEQKLLSQKQGNNFLEKQILVSLNHISLSPSQSIVIAYEPVWAIGTGTSYHASCDPILLKTKIDFLKTIMLKKFGVHLAKRVSYIYGGSVTSKTSHAFIKEGTADGLLVGTASLDLKEFNEIIDSIV